MDLNVLLPHWSASTKSQPQSKPRLLSDACVRGDSDQRLMRVSTKNAALIDDVEAGAIKLERYHRRIFDVNHSESHWTLNDCSGSRFRTQAARSRVDINWTLESVCDWFSEFRFLIAIGFIFVMVRRSKNKHEEKAGFTIELFCWVCYFPLNPSASQSAQIASESSIRIHECHWVFSPRHIFVAWSVRNVPNWNDCWSLTYLV